MRDGIKMRFCTKRQKRVYIRGRCVEECSTDEGLRGRVHRGEEGDKEHPISLYGTVCWPDSPDLAHLPGKIRGLAGAQLEGRRSGNALIVNRLATTDPRWWGTLSEKGSNRR